MAKPQKLTQADIQALRKKSAATASGGKPRRKPIAEIAIVGILVAGVGLWMSQREKKVTGMLPVAAGCFSMGAPAEEYGAQHSERPQHSVCLDAFQMDITEVTQAAYQQAMGNNPSHFTGCLTCPVESVTWDEASAYCQKQGKRLPTEAEWEYAARAGTLTQYFWGAEYSAEHSWSTLNNTSKRTQPVRTVVANPWGLYDMTGNVWEWVADWADNEYYASAPEKNPKGPTSGTSRIVRGGSYNAKPRNLRSAARGWAEPWERLDYIGFRCAK